MWTLHDARNRLGAVVRAALNYRRTHKEVARRSFVNHLLAFSGTIKRAGVAIRRVEFGGSSNTTIPAGE